MWRNCNGLSKTSLYWVKRALIWESRPVGSAAEWEFPRADLRPIDVKLSTNLTVEAVEGRL